MKGEGELIRLASDRLGEDTQWLEGWGASRSTQPVAQQQVRDTAAMWKSCRGELEAPEVSGANKKKPMKHLKGKQGCSAMKVTRPTAQMKCLYTNACSMRNKQEELETIVLLENYHLIAITETWWDESYDWNAALDGYRLFRRDRRGRRGGGIALYIKKTLQSEELSLKKNHEQVESLWVRIRERGNSHDWHAVIDGYRLFRKDRPTRRGGGVALYMREQVECIELGLGANEEQVESLWVRIK